MCTVSWLREAEGTPPAPGYRLWFNRDERRDRAAELPARELEQDGVRLLAPLDGEAGGAWIAVNEFGLTVGLLNGYVESKGPPSSTPRSRGRLVLDVAHSCDLETLATRLTSEDLTTYEPFVLLGLATAGEAHAWRWDGATLSLRSGDGELSPLASSGVVQEEAQQARTALHADLTRSGLTPETLDRFHRSHGPLGPDALGPCMHRADAATRSLVRIHVTSRHVSLDHAPGAPCTKSASQPLTLVRQTT